MFRISGELRNEVRDHPVLLQKEVAEDELRQQGNGIEVAALALLGGCVAAALHNRNRTSRADNTLAGDSPALLAGTPSRQLYPGPRLARAVTIEDLRKMAHRRLPRFALEYLEGGSETEAALARNLAALSEWHFRPRSFVDVSNVELSTVLFGRKTAMPIAIAPTGLNGLFWPHADLCLAEAAAAAGIVFAQSTMSNDAMEAVARIPNLRHWWQLYLFGSTEVHDALICHAHDVGCEALVITADAQIYGNREWEERTRSGSKWPTLPAMIETLSHHAWITNVLLAQGMPAFANVLDFIPRSHRRFFASASWIRAKMNRSLSWETVARIRDRWRRKLILKGLLDVGDVEKAMRIGADAVALSNHGGRQLDYVVAPLDVLPAARAAVGDRMTLIVDGGMRRGSDVLKGIALGADLVFMGRAPLYGVAAAGRAGVQRALEILRSEMARDLGLLGVPAISSLRPERVVRLAA